METLKTAGVALVETTGVEATVGGELGTPPTRNVPIVSHPVLAPDRSAVYA